MSGYYEARQHLNLSQLAFEIIEADKFEFTEKASRDQMINMILSSFMEDSDAAIDNAAQRYREDLQNKLTTIPNGKTKQAAIDLLVSANSEELKEKAGSYPKEHSFKTHLNDRNYNRMQEWRDEGDYYNGSAGAFIKAVIEEYARKPFFEREAILFRDLIFKIKAATVPKQGQLLDITLHNGSSFEVKPYCVCGDSGYNYHYLVGYSKKKGSESEKPASFRLSRIKDIRISDARSGKITQKQEAEIKKRLHDVGVQFLLEEPEIIKIMLTPQGKKMFEQQAHLRPNYMKREACSDGTWLYEFNCTQKQVEFYFFKFGEDAHILFPVELKNRFLKKYSSAAICYSNESPE